MRNEKILNRTYAGQRVAICALAFLIAGCASTGSRSGNRPKQADLSTARALYEQRRYTEAIIQCIDLSRASPQPAGLPELQNAIMLRLTEERAKVATMRAATGAKRMDLDVESRKDVPDTYGLLRTTPGKPSYVRATPNAMEQAIRKKITLHLDNVNLDSFILAVGAAENINIISDSLNSTGTMTIHAENVPLAEVLDYVSRNLGIAFYVGENIIWATPGEKGKPAVPMETRVYHLRRGLSSDELGGSRVDIIDAIEKFVAKPDGADLLFNRKAHVLIARNTRENLARIENIIETLDVCPPQVLIEARFISTTVTDLRELGIDWVLDSPIVVTRKGGDGETVIKTGSNIQFNPFQNKGVGMNMTYQGLLTDPMFTAVLHALETSGKARTLSSPRVTTVNNKEAKIRVGKDFRYFEEYDIQSVPSNVSSQGQTVYSSVLVPVGTPQLKELGIELTVTPSVGSDLQTVTLNLVPKISDFDRYEYYQVGDPNATGANSGSGTTGTATTTNTTSMVKLPIFKTSELETEMIVQSGETVVMGGLISATENKTQERIPLLGSIPLIGRFFRHDSVEGKKENLLIFVTATILSERGESLVPMAEGAAQPAAN